MKFLIFLFPFFVLSQEQLAKGVVVDSDTDLPIPYVNISVLESEIGTSSDEEGNYTLTIENNNLHKNVKLSSLGYKDTTLLVSSFLKVSKLVLQPLNEQLDEVVISKKFEEKTLEINKITEDDLCQGFGSSFRNPWILALYFPFEEHYKNTEYLKSVRFHFGNFKNNKAKFRLRLYTIGNDGLPQKDLLKENVIVTLKKKQKTVDIDVSDYAIIFPREGLYVAFEWLYIPFNEEEVTFHFGKNNKKKEKRIRHNPIISGICAEEGKYKMAAYISGEWKVHSSNKFQSDLKTVPAITLTLSN